MSEDPKKVSKNDLRNSQFGGGFVDAETVHANRIGGDTYNNYNVGLNQQPTLTRQEYRNRKVLLTKVKNYWVKVILKQSLYNQVLIELGLEERPDVIAHPLSDILEIGDSSPQPLPKGTKIIDIFDDIGAGRTLLILGEPGSGKTTTLLELTRDLIDLAEQDINLLIPVFFNLSSWANKRQKIEDGLMDELHSFYDVPKKIGQSLVNQQQLLLLLDGLDEVKAEYRDDCIVALNQFKKCYGSELVVCSRIKDYEALSKRLEFQSAVRIKLLSLEQVNGYFKDVGANLTGLRTLMAEDRVLQELAQSPLILNIMTLAYQGVALEDLPRTEVVEERRQQLFDDYIEKMFHRHNRSKSESIYSETQTKHWLAWLAHKMIQESQTVFLIERMQPNWLSSKYKLFLFIIINYLIDTAIFLPFISCLSLLYFRLYNLWSMGNEVFNYDIVLDTYILFFCFLLSGFIGKKYFQLPQKIKTIEKIGFLWIKFFRGLIYGLFYGIFFGIFYEIVFGKITNFIIRIWKLLIKFLDNHIIIYIEIILGITAGIILGLAIGIFSDGEVGINTVLLIILLTFIGFVLGVVGVHFFVLTLFILFIFPFIPLFLIEQSYFIIIALLDGVSYAITFSVIKNRSYPNQGIITSGVYAVIGGFIFFLIIGLTTGLIIGLTNGLIIGLVIGVSFGLICGGKACIQHFTLRLILYCNNYVPWNYARFLDYATDRIFLQKVGGGYIFIHRTLMEHFAEIEQKQQT